MLETIREYLHRNPFQPFRIVVTSGDRYDVPNPDLVAVLPTQLFVAEARSNRFHFLRLNQIAAIEVMPEAA
ncbi:MAG: hypothetical protein WD042_08310 [Phycisphaeraceae bacterium]